jgi:hypothetical protein
MRYIIHNPSAEKNKAMRAEILAYCKPHGINPKQVFSITVDMSQEKYVIEYYNKDGHFCTIEVHGTISIKMKKLK